MPQQKPVLTDDLRRFWWDQVRTLPRIERHTLLRQLYARYGDQVRLLPVAPREVAAVAAEVAA